MERAWLTTTDVVKLIHEQTGEYYSPDAVRHWERDGLLRVAGRTPGGWRLYRPTDVIAFLRSRHDHP